MGFHFFSDEKQPITRSWRLFSVNYWIDPEAKSQYSMSELFQRVSRAINEDLDRLENSELNTSQSRNFKSDHVQAQAVSFSWF
jgi:hypothetical protein